MTDFLIIAFGLGSIFTAFFVISSNNPIHSVFFLVLTFANVSGILILLGIEFLAIIFWIVYVGAIAILFIFVIKLIDIKAGEAGDIAHGRVPIGFIIGFLLFLEFYLFMDSYDISPLRSAHTAINYTDVAVLSNTEELGKLLYTKYYMNFLIGSLILLVAMVGAIILTLSHEEEIKRQDIFSQIIRS